MATEFAPRPFGRTGFPVGRIGLAAGYGAPAEAVERAFERGLNYFYWGSRRTETFANGLRALLPQRDRFLLAIQSYSRIASLVSWSLERALRKLGTDHADVLLLGMWNRPVTPAILDAALRLRERGLVRWLAVSTHKRTLVPAISADSPFDIVHFRYNAVHPGAERDIFAHVPVEGPRAGLVCFTATSWRQLLNAKKVPPGERTPTAADCYRFALTPPHVDVCMAGPANAVQFEDVLRALEGGPMNEEELEWMRKVGAAIYRRQPPGFPRD